MPTPSQLRRLERRRREREANPTPKVDPPSYTTEANKAKLTAAYERRAAYWDRALGPPEENDAPVPDRL